MKTANELRDIANHTPRTNRLTKPAEVLAFVSEVLGSISFDVDRTDLERALLAVNQIKVTTQPTNPEV